jgi:hypothetical protein
MAERERTIERVSRTPDLMGERGPNPKSGLSTPVRGEMSDGHYIYLFFHQQGGPDIVDDDLIGLTHVQALALVAARALPHWR